MNDINVNDAFWFIFGGIVVWALMKEKKDE
jgi:hypothetical protein